MDSRQLRLFVVVLTASFAWPAGNADDWPGFRGATGNGISTETGLPVHWSTERNLKWQIDLPGRGNSSPVVVADRVYLSTQDEARDLWVLALNRADGRTIWRTKLIRGELSANGPRNLWAHRHNPATPTLAANAEGVWAFFGTGDLFGLDLEGKQRWHRNLVQEYGAYDITFGMGSSPRLWKSLLYVNCITKGPSYVLALATDTGRTVWKTDRQLPAFADGADAYSTPAIWEKDGQAELLVAGAEHINAYDPATGRQKWISGGLGIRSRYGRIIASPAVSRDVILQCAGNPGGGGNGRVIALQAGGTGDITATGRLWNIERTAPDSATPVCYRGYAFLVRGNGVTVCAELKTGRKLWEERLTQGEYFSSTIAGDGKIYVLATNGTCSVVAAEPQFNRLAENRLPGTFYATPAVSDGTLFLRSETALFAIETAD